MVGVSGTEKLWPHQLDRGWARQQIMLGPPYLAHSSAAEALNQAVRPESPRARHFLAQSVDHLSSHIRHDCNEEVGEDQPEKEFAGSRTRHRVVRDDEADH